jgi:integrase
MTKLTKRTVDAAKPEGRDYFLWDDDLPGFGLRVFASGRKSWLIQYRMGRTLRRFTIGPHGAFTPDEARTRAAKLLQSIRDGADPAEDKQERLNAETVAELAERYLGAEGREKKPRKKESSWKRDENAIRCHVLPLLGRKIVRSLTQAQIERFQIDVAEGKTARDEKTGFRRRSIVRGGKGTAARATAALRAMLSFAVARKLIATNPATGVELFKPKTIERPLYEHEIGALARGMAILEDLGMLSPNMAAAVELLLLTGARKTEITALRWDYVDFQRGALMLPDSKVGARPVPLSSAAIRVLSELPRRSEWVLPSTRTEGPIVGLQKAWEMVRVWCGFEDARLHDLRHSFATYAVTEGASLYLVGKVLGHKQTRTTERYAHVANNPVRAVADQTADVLAKLMSAKLILP